MSSGSAFNMNSINNINNLSQNILYPQNRIPQNQVHDLDSSFKKSLVREDEYNYDNWFENYTKRNKQTSSFADLTLKDIYKNCISSYNNIIIELTDLFSSKKLFTKINNNNNFYHLIYIYLKNISFIIFKSSRLLYVGILFCVISFFVYFIFVTK